MVDILVAVATPLEGAGIPPNIAGRSIAVVATGVGLVNAAIGLLQTLQREPARAVVVCGIGGAYPGSGLEIGDVVCAESEAYGDLGAETPDGFLDLAALGFGVTGAIGGARLPLDLYPAARRAAFLTCAMATGTDARAAALVARTGAAVESMEGAALVQAARAGGVPVGEIRGISNRAGRRDRDTWRIADAAAAARAALLAWIEEGAC